MTFGEIQAQKQVVITIEGKKKLFTVCLGIKLLIWFHMGFEVQIPG